jgi:hypothetical protein
MRLVKLSVHRFQCIESADVDFGPGLNVLYGPNDIGKSSLAWAIRAVLLLQHNSSQHERFVSWHGGGEPPRVALTFADAANRYWRVSKTFGGTAGRSSLEVSKDGITFTTDANARLVDEKLRKMLGWGINAPGGQSGSRGLPDTFLVQVLLAEQDDVRKLLESSLGKDQNESGRARLTEALDALAQDPLFKKILTVAQAHHDMAFTALGRRRTSASSPFVEIDARIKGLERDHEELQAKLRDTTLAETKIREVAAQRDNIDRELREAREALTAMEQRLGLQRQRDLLREQIEGHQATIRGAAELQQAIKAAQQALLGLQQEAQDLAGRARESAALASQAEVIRDEARRRLDDLTRGDTEADRQLDRLAEARRVAQEVVHDTQRGVERAAETLKLARDTSVGFKEALAAAGAATAASGRADEASSAAANEVRRLRQTVAGAEQQLRDATSDNKARARELRRSELHNRRLTLQAARAGHEETLQRVAAIKDAHARAAAAEVTRAGTVAQIGAAKRAIDAEGAELARVDATRASLASQERYGQLRQHRDALATAMRITDEIRKHRDRTAQLRSEEAALRANIRATVPSADRISALRTLRDSMRIAEAKLEVGLAVTIRPRRGIAFRTAVDGAAETATTSGEPVTVTARRAVAIRFDDLADVEISAGEESARANVAAMRARWDAEGATILRDHEVDTVEELEALRSETDANTRAADERRRDAENANQRAEQLDAVVGNTAELSLRIAELERDLEAADPAVLERALDRLGAGWQAAIKRSMTDAEHRRQTVVAAIETMRQQFARLDAQREVQSASCDAVARQLAELAATVPNADATETATEIALAQVDRELAAVEHDLAVFSDAITDEESRARANVSVVAKALADAERAHEEQQRIASQAREAMIQCSTRLDEIRRRAHGVDTQGVWHKALVEGAKLSLEHWQLASASAEHHKIEAKTAFDDVVSQIDELARERSATVKTARESLEQAEASVRSSRATSGDLAARSAASNDEIGRQRIALADMRTQAASTNLDGARLAIQDLQGQLEALGSSTEVVSAGDVEHWRSTVGRLEASLWESEQELAKARGALEQVGGAIVREQQRELDRALEQARAREREVVVEYDAWKMLVEAMKATESAEGAHLGRALGIPVSQRFRELTGGRYGTLELGAHLESNGIHAAGALRAIEVLSAGTQDQLATLLRLCIAEQLRSWIVLDDHLSQSDPDRVGWFNSVLRSAAKQVQIVFITCRPSEVLKASELPTGDAAAKVAAAGQLHAIDLTRVIRRFHAPSTPAVDGA